jgi:hypothetical protein
MRITDLPPALFSRDRDLVNSGLARRSEGPRIVHFASDQAVGLSRPRSRG